MDHETPTPALDKPVSNAPEQDTETPHQSRFTIPRYRRDEFLKRIQSLTRRAQKLGVTPPGVAELPNTRRMEQMTRQESEAVYDPMLGSALAPRNVQTFAVEVEDWLVTTVPIKLPGEFRYVGRIEHTDHGNALCAAPGMRFDPNWQSAPSGCVHCNTQRNRADTFVVADASGGQHQVGRNCLCDYFSGHTPSNLAQMFEFQSNVVTLLEEFGDSDRDRELMIGGRGVSKAYDAEHLMAFAAAAIRNYGFVSRAKAKDPYEPHYATADTVRTLLALHGTVQWAAVKAEEKPSEQDHTTAREILQWMETLSDADENTFKAQLAVIARQGFVAESQLGLACAAFAARKRDLAKEKERNKPDVGFFGEVGKRVSAEVDVDGVIQIPDQGFGAMEIVKMHTVDTGHELAWFTKSGSFALHGRRYLVKLTPKEHKQWQGRSQTAVSRVACIREVEVAPPPTLSQDEPKGIESIQCTASDALEVQEMSRRSATKEQERARD